MPVMSEWNVSFFLAAGECKTYVGAQVWGLVGRLEQVPLELMWEHFYGISTSWVPLCVNTRRTFLIC